ncbi:MAG: hypothetical protein CMO80_03210 [Verrucomicrobiales bacterium]|nr:hypothetical protein [Verrucomicrobiales bacterium]|tara:strand:+ start:899 stop:1315 length:417 start_codon:yes stop_codon:yes gene_type:complete
MQFTVRKRRQAPAVVIVSLIDVLIVVLIFLVSSTQFKKPTAVTLALPESTTSKPAGEHDGESIIVEIAKDSPHLYLNGEVVETNLLFHTIQQAVKRDQEALVAIRADEKAPFGVIIQVMDLAKNAGLKNLSAFTKKAE